MPIPIVAAFYVGMKIVAVLGKVASTVSAGRKAYSISLKEKVTRADVVNGVAQIVFCTLQAGVLAKTVVHVGNAVALTASVCTGSADVVRVATDIIAKKGALQLGDAPAVLVTATFRVSDTLLGGLQPHSEHLTSCGSWICDNKEPLENGAQVLSTISQVSQLSVDPGSKKTPLGPKIPPDTTQAVPSVNNVQSAKRYTDAIQKINEQDDQRSGYAKSWRTLDFVPEYVAKEADIPRCALSSNPIRHLVYVRINGGVSYFEKSAVDAWFGKHPNTPPEGWPEGQPFSKDLFKDDPDLQEDLIDKQLEGWARYNVLQLVTV